MQKKQAKTSEIKGIWQFQKAKSQLSEVMDEVQKKGKQIIVRHGDEVFIVLSEKKYEELTSPNSTLFDFLQNSPCPEINFEENRSKDLPRELDL